MLYSAEVEDLEAEFPIESDVPFLSCFSGDQLVKYS